MALWKLQWFIGSDELRFLEASMALSHVKNDGSVSYFCFMFCFNVSMWHVKFVCFSIHVLCSRSCDRLLYVSCCCSVLVMKCCFCFALAAFLFNAP